MLGEKIAEEAGKVTSQRVLPNGDGFPRLEISFQAKGHLLGVKTTNIGTYFSVMRPDGTLFGEGQGIVTSKKGDVATWSGQAVGKLNADGSTSFRGAVFYQSRSAKWEGLHGLALVFEHDVDSDGNTKTAGWEWK